MGGSLFIIHYHKPLDISGCSCSYHVIIHFLSYGNTLLDAGNIKSRKECSLSVALTMFYGRMVVLVVKQATHALIITILSSQLTCN